MSNNGHSVFMGSVTGLANMAAGVITFLLTPLLHARSAEWVDAFTRQHYGHDWANAMDFVWWVIVALTVFFVARATVSTLLVMGGLAFALRFI